MTRTMVAAAALAAVMAAGADAGEKPKVRGQQSGAGAVKRIDANGDGKVTQAEFNKALEKRGKTPPGPIGEGAFKRIDFNQDGVVTTRELEGARKEMAKQVNRNKGGFRKK